MIATLFHRSDLALNINFFRTFNRSSLLLFQLLRQVLDRTCHVSLVALSCRTFFRLLYLGSKIEFGFLRSFTFSLQGGQLLIADYLLRLLASFSVLLGSDASSLRYHWLISIFAILIVGEADQVLIFYGFAGKNFLLCRLFILG